MEDKINQNIYIDIEGILDDHDKKELLHWIQLPAFQIAAKVVREAEYQWGYQLIKKNYIEATDGAAIKDIIKTQGQREGLLILINSFIQWKKKIEQKQKK